MAWKQSIPLLALILGVSLGACTPSTPTVSITASPSAPATSELSDQINVLATQTRIADETETARIFPATSTIGAEQGTFTGTPALTPIPSVSVLEQVGAFEQVSPKQALIAGRVNDLQVNPDGSILVLSESGYSRFMDGEWTGYFTEEIGPLVGIDGSGRAWAVSRDGGRIAAWQDDQWIQFGVNEGWITPTQTTGNPVTTGVVHGPDGDLWLATGSDVRRLAGSRWQTFTPEAMGMPVTPTLDSSPIYTLMPIPSTGELWVGHCDWGAIGPDGGGGIRRFSQGGWQEVDPSLSTGCVTAIHLGAGGDVWIGKDAAIHRLAAGSSTWEPIGMPETPPGYRFGSVASLTSAPAGDIWASLSLCDAANCYIGELLYHLTGEGWRQVGEINPAGGQELLFDASGTPWLFSGGNAYQIKDDSLQPVAGLLVQAAARDPNGDIWLVAQSTGAPTLWKQVGNK